MSAQATLFHPFATGALPMPGADGRALFLGAEPGIPLPDGFEAELLLAQGFRPFFLGLQREGWQVAPEASGEDYDLALVLGGRHRGLNEARLMQALAWVKPGGLVAVAGTKADGIDAFRKRVAEWPGVDGHVSKYHGVAFWLSRPEAPPPLPPSFLDPSRPALAEWVSAPGMFSFDRVDAGSKLLAEHLPADLKGEVADFGAGWGYLAVEVAKRCPKVAAVDLFEADWAALEAAKRNWSRHGGGREARFFWHDLLSEPVAGRYDAVVMNPPFHQGRAAEPLIGQGMIKAAAKALNKGGRLFLVANQGLPYEQTLRAEFASVEEETRQKGFKVISARR